MLRTILTEFFIWTKLILDYQKNIGIKGWRNLKLKLISSIWSMWLSFLVPKKKTPKKN